MGFIARRGATCRRTVKFTSDGRAGGARPRGSDRLLGETVEVYARLAGELGLDRTRMSSQSRPVGYPVSREKAFALIGKARRRMLRPPGRELLGRRGMNVLSVSAIGERAA